MKQFVAQLFERGSKILLGLERPFFNFMRISIFVVMAWIGGLKACQYEADGIVHFVSNSPFMCFLYNNSDKYVENEKGEMVKEYTLYKNPEVRWCRRISTGTSPTVLTPSHTVWVHSLF